MYGCADVPGIDPTVVAVVIVSLVLALGGHAVN